MLRDLSYIENVRLSIRFLALERASVERSGAPFKRAVIRLSFLMTSLELI
jgi:hypothetical protein